jgi:BASS family bile acid:Na+ symporter
MRNWHWPLGLLGDGQFTLPLALLALMLFSAALLTDLAQIRGVLGRPLALCLGLLAVWLGPTLVVIAAGWVVPRLVDGEAMAGLLVGTALVASMPVANSSVGWSQNAGGNLALSLALVVLSISLSPFVTPQLLSLLGMSLSPGERAYSEALVNQFSGWFFVVWVILPTVAGLICRPALGRTRIKSIGGWAVVTSAGALLLLNYINSSLALPKVRSAQPLLLATTSGLAIALAVVGLILAAALARLLKLDGATGAALAFGLSMKHTGLALILAGAVLADEPLAILLIVLATLAQHAMAGVVQWARQPGARRPV